MRLIVITTETFFENEAEAINLLFKNGLETLHLRKPFASQHETLAFIRQINKTYFSRIVLHDFHDLAVLFHLKGIHLNRRNQSIQMGFQPEINNLQEDKGMSMKKCVLTVSRSCHSLEEVNASSDCDYVFLSPVFQSISKIGYGRGFSPEQLNEAKEQKIINEQVIALGGITADNIPATHRYGFGGVAVLGALWGDFAAKKNVSALLNRFMKLKMVCEEHECMKFVT